MAKIQMGGMAAMTNATFTDIVANIETLHDTVVDLTREMAPIDRLILTIHENTNAALDAAQRSLNNIKGLEG